jgi:hypothetical protein
MKKLMIVCLSLIFLVGCASVSIQPNPRDDMCFYLNSPCGPRPVCLKSGEFDLSLEEREYKIFDTFEEMKKFLLGIMSGERKSI